MHKTRVSLIAALATYAPGNQGAGGGMNKTINHRGTETQRKAGAIALLCVSVVRGFYA